MTFSEIIGEKEIIGEGCYGIISAIRTIDLKMWSWESFLQVAASPHTIKLL